MIKSKAPAETYPCGALCVCQPSDIGTTRSRVGAIFYADLMDNKIVPAVGARLEQLGTVPASRRPIADDRHY